MHARTPEQASFAAAIDAFCRAKTGTRAQRDALTHDGTEAHSPAPLRPDGGARLARAWVSPLSTAARAAA